MNSAMRWRIVSLQAILVVVLAAAGGFAFAMGSFTTSQIHDELAAQQIYFPGADQIKAGGALDPAKFPQEIRDQAGKQVLDGNQARIYANDFLAVHLRSVANGETYSQVSTDLQTLNAKIKATSPSDPGYASLQAQATTLNGEKTTLFQGETLRSMLLNAYGWWTVGLYTTFAAIGLVLAAIVVLGALVFEVVAERRPARMAVAERLAA